MSDTQDAPRTGTDAVEAVRIGLAEYAVPLADFDAAIKLALETNDRPVVIDFVVSADAMVWPMVPQGVSNSYIQYARDHAPSFDEED